MSFNLLFNFVYNICYTSYMAFSYLWTYTHDIICLILLKIGYFELTTIDLGWSRTDGSNVGWETAADITWLPAWQSFVVPLILTIIAIISMWFIFKKANEKGFKALIPFYSTFTLCKITFGSGWYMFLYFIPIVQLFVYIIMYMKLGKKFNKSKLFTLGLVILTPIFMLVLAFDKSEFCE
ncbi:DUF5684 domain-containing protein [Anaerofustis stercorihominis]|uniref:DUF5684 domain-containing protein n=1 Tax=Anaerofustis stercorihominis TaxID=214853 RepID=UPI001FA8EF36|nr:DUF5684 domain-containing protein [Anaerofustis stercorihominis]